MSVLCVVLLAVASCDVRAFASPNKASWPCVMLREVSEPDSLPALRQILSIHGRHPGSVDEMWLSGSGIFKDAKTCRDLMELATLRKDSAGAGIALGFQQGFTLGHADLAAAGILPDEMKDVFPYPVDAWAVGRDGKRLENLCARSTDVQKREEEYVEMLVRVLNPDSLWLDDDLRMGFWKPDGCFCPRCIEAFNREEHESVTREELVERLFVRDGVDGIRSKWFRFNDRSCAQYAAAVRRALDRTNPNCRLGLQLTSAFNCYNGEHRGALFAAASGNGQSPVGVRIAGGMYREGGSPRDLLKWMFGVMKMIGDARRLSPGMIGSFALEDENYSREAINKSAEAILRQAALGFAAGCDATTLYSYWHRRAEPMALVEEFAELLAQWRPYFNRLSEVSKRTSSCGVALKVEDGWQNRLPMSLKGGGSGNQGLLSLAYESYDRCNGILALYGIPVVPYGAGEVALLDGREFDAFKKEGWASALTTDEAEKLRDELDARSGNRIPVRVGKNHALATFPRVDGEGRLVAVTFFNLSMGTVRKMPVRLRSPVGERFVWCQETHEDVELKTTGGESQDERCIVLPDLPGYTMATVFVVE